MNNIAQGKPLICLIATFMQVSDDGDLDIEITYEAAGNKGMESGML